MKRTARDNRPNVKPIEKIEVSEKHIGLRVAALIICIVIAVAALSAGITGLLKKDTGWRTVLPKSVDGEPDCFADFTLQYNFGASGISASSEFKAVEAKYAEASKKARKLYSSGEIFDGVHNPAYISEHINEEITVEPELYKAFEIMLSGGSRYLYAEPVYEYYEVMLAFENEEDLYDYDANSNPEKEKLFSEILAFANDSESVELKLLGNNKVKLFVSDAYKKFAKENDVYKFIGFVFMKNAFIIDDLADALFLSGHTRGYIASSDGFCRNLDTSGEEYGYEIYDFDGKTVNTAATVYYSGRKSIVALRSYPLGTSVSDRYFVLKNGEIRNGYFDIHTGKCKTAINDLVSYSDKKGCAEILSEMIPVFIADEFSSEALEKAEQIETVYCLNGEIHASDKDIKIKK